MDRDMIGNEGKLILYYAGGTNNRHEFGCGLVII